MSSSSQLLCRVLVLRSLHLPSQPAMGFCCLQSLPLTLGARSAPFWNTNPQPHPQPPGMPAKWNPFIQIYVSLWALVSVQLVEQNWKLTINSVWQNMQTCLRKYLTDSGGSNQGWGVWFGAEKIRGGGTIEQPRCQALQTPWWHRTLRTKRFIVAKFNAKNSLK